MNVSIILSFISGASSLSSGGEDSDEEGFLDGDGCSEVVADSDGLGFSDW